MFADLTVFDDDNDDIELLNREGEMQEVIERFGDPRSADDLLISGPSGVGKTLFATKILDKIGTMRPIHRVHVNCLGQTTAGILRRCLDDHPNGSDNVPQTRATDAVRDDLEAAIDRETIIVLDEGDDLPYTDAISDLFEISDVTIIAIAHEGTEWLAQLDVDDSHSFDQGHIELDHYHVDELEEILERRARQGFHHSVVSSTQLHDLADEVAGVARNGIQRLWGAADIAKERGHFTVHDTDIRDGKERAWRRIRRFNLESLPYHHRVLYAIVHEAGEISGEDLHDRYDEVAEDVYHNKAPQSIRERARRKKFEKLKRYDLVDYAGPTSDRTYWVIDEEVEPQKVELPAAATQS
ncbi:Cdc6/Cdc18 family protein [Natrinema sp. LN54]|uniref:Cdc6/Cdc18 family protein n=1 Tax=Natrinema sp. LN54 TaxID=3458705 RepID=UPI004035530D